MQQSSYQFHIVPFVSKSLLQLLIPQMRFPAQSASLSQSPPPSSHWLEVEQQSESTTGFPGHLSSYFTIEIK